MTSMLFSRLDAMQSFLVSLRSMLEASHTRASGPVLDRSASE